MLIRPALLPVAAGLREDVRALDRWAQAPDRFGSSDPPDVAEVAAELRARGPGQQTLRDAAHLARVFQEHGRSPEPFVGLVADWQAEGLIAGPPDLVQQIVKERVVVEGTAVPSRATPEFSPLAAQFVPARTGYFLDGQDEARAFASLAKEQPRVAAQLFPALLHQSGLARGEAAGRLLVPALFEQATRSPELAAVLGEHLELLLTVIPEAESRGCLGRPEVPTPDSVVPRSSGWSGFFRGLATLTPCDSSFIDAQVKPFLLAPDSDWRLGAFSFLTQQLPRHPELAQHVASLALPVSQTDQEHELLIEAARQGWRPDSSQKALLFGRLEGAQASSFHSTARLLGKLCGAVPDALSPAERSRVAQAVVARTELASSLCDPDPPGASCVHALKAFVPELKALSAARVESLQPFELLQDANVLALTSFVEMTPEELGGVAEKLRPLLVEGHSEPAAARHAVGRLRDMLLSKGGTPRELLALNLGRAASHVSPRDKQRELAIHERILELAGARPEGPPPPAPLDQLSVQQLVDLALQPPDPEALREELASSGQPERVQIACSGLYRTVLERALTVLRGDAPPPERLKAFRQGLMAFHQGGLPRPEDFDQAWLGGFPDLSRWGEDRYEVANELAGASPDRAALDRHHSRLARLHDGTADQALTAYRQLRELAPTEERLEAATDRMAELQSRFGGEALELSAFVEGLGKPDQSFGRFCDLYGRLADLPLVQGSFRRGHDEHLAHLSSVAKDAEVTLKTWKAILPRLEAGERYQDVWMAELGLTMGVARQDTTAIALGEGSITIGGVRLPTRRRA